MDREYLCYGMSWAGKATANSDVFSFGVFLLRLLVVGSL